MTPSSDIRWQQRFDNMRSAHEKLRHAARANAEKPGDELFQMALIKAFEMTFELSWKTLKDYLDYNGITVKLPREVLKEGFAQEILADGQLWIDMLQDRNLMAHTYDEARAVVAVGHICGRYLAGIDQLYAYLAQRLS